LADYRAFCGIGQRVKYPAAKQRNGAITPAEEAKEMVGDEGFEPPTPSV
jgi:hypothetical protein